MARTTLSDLPQTLDAAELLAVRGGYLSLLGDVRLSFSLKGKGDDVNISFDSYSLSYAYGDKNNWF